MAMKINTDLRLKLLDNVMRSFVLKAPPHLLMLAFYNGEWKQLFESCEEGEFLDEPLSETSSDEMKELLKPHLGEALADAFGAKKFVIKW